MRDNFRILSIGNGNSVAAEKLARRGFPHVHAIDFEANVTKVMQQRADRASLNVVYHHMDIRGTQRHAI